MKHLTIEVVTVFDKKALRIKEQTHLGDRFGDDCCRFTASNGFELSSQTHPQVDCLSATLFVRGNRPDRDNEIIVVPDGEWLSKLRVAVKEYNQKFSDTSTKSEGYELIE